jgi:hypothetical protein
MMKFTDATRPGEIEHRFTCFPDPGTRDQAEMVAEFVDQAEAWARERGHVERRNKYVMKVWPTELAIEFKLRWC